MSFQPVHLPTATFQANMQTNGGSGTAKRPFPSIPLRRGRNPAHQNRTTLHSLFIPPARQGIQREPCSGTETFAPALPFTGDGFVTLRKIFHLAWPLSSTSQVSCFILLRSFFRVLLFHSPEGSILFLHLKPSSMRRPQLRCLPQPHTFRC